MHKILYQHLLKSLIVSQDAWSLISDAINAELSSLDITINIYLQSNILRFKV